MKRDDSGLEPRNLGGRDLGSARPADPVPVRLGDKFVTPVDAISWLDAKTLRPLAAMHEAPWPADFPPDSPTFGLIVSGPFEVRHQDGPVETGVWLRWEFRDGAHWAVYDTVERSRSWLLQAVELPEGGRPLTLIKVDVGYAEIVPASVPWSDFKAAVVTWSSQEYVDVRAATVPALRYKKDSTGDDRFVIPAEAVTWLDPSMFPKSGYGVPMQMTALSDLPEPGVRPVPDHRTLDQP